MSATGIISIETLIPHKEITPAQDAEIVEIIRRECGVRGIGVLFGHASFLDLFDRNRFSNTIRIAKLCLRVLTTNLTITPTQLTRSKAGNFFFEFFRIGQRSFHGYDLPAFFDITTSGVATPIPEFPIIEDEPDIAIIPAIPIAQEINAAEDQNEHLNFQDEIAGVDIEAEVEEYEEFEELEENEEVEVEMGVVQVEHFQEFNGFEENEDIEEVVVGNPVEISSARLHDAFEETLNVMRGGTTVEKINFVLLLKSFLERSYDEFPSRPMQEIINEINAMPDDNEFIPQLDPDTDAVVITEPNVLANDARGEQILSPLSIAAGRGIDRVVVPNDVDAHENLSEYIFINF